MIQRIPMFFVFLLATLLAISACGGSDSGGETPMAACMKADASFTPCGGDLIGTWVIEAGCSNNFDLGLLCDEARTSVRVEYLDDATIQFDGETFVSSAARVHMESTLKFPLSCLDAPVPSCAALSDPGTIECTGTTNCSCMMSMEDENENAGTTNAYQVSGTRITIGEAGDSAEYDYCIEGDRLRMKMIASETTGGLSLTMVGSRRAE